MDGWYILGDDDKRDTRSPMSWKDILEQSVLNPTAYSEYARNPTAGIRPSKNHRLKTEEQVYLIHLFITNFGMVLFNFWSAVTWTMIIWMIQNLMSRKHV